LIKISAFIQDLNTIFCVNIKLNNLQYIYTSRRGAASCLWNSYFLPSCYCFWDLPSAKPQFWH